MKRLFSSILLAAALAPLAGYSETVNTWTNAGTLTFPPQVDATNFINYGIFDIFTSSPFDTSNTRNFTNNGSMFGSVGFRFDTAPRNNNGQLIAPRRLAANFHNRNGGLISAADSTLLNGNSGSYLLVHATNIINQGILSVGGGGMLQLVGSNVNLGYSGLGVEVITPQGSFNQVPTTNDFFPDIAVYDNYWGQTNMNIDTAAIILPSGGVRSPLHRVTYPGGFTFSTRVSVGNPYASAFSNMVDMATITITNMDGSTVETNVVTNFVRQAVFVGINNPSNTTVDISFSPSSEPTNAFRTVHVLLSIPTTNVFTAGFDDNTVYFEDTLASEAFRGVLTNFNDPGTARPANYLVSRVQQGIGSIGNDFITTNYLYDRSFSNRVVSGDYAGYSAFFDNLTFRPPAVPGGTVTNLPGRVMIDADNLDLYNARIRAGGLVQIEANHLVRSSGAVVDCQNINYFLGAPTNGTLVVQNLLKESVARVQGDIYAWSGVWSNAYSIELDNYTIDDETGEATLEPIVVSISAGLYALILNANSLLDQLPVEIHDFHARGTNVVIGPNDNGSVSEAFLVDGESLTLQGVLRLQGNLVHWVNTNAPSLKYFTNTGTLSIPGEAHFGDDRPAPYVAFVNRGRIESEGFFVNSDYCEMAGTNAINGPATIISRSAKFQSGRISAAELALQGNVFKLDRSALVSNNRLNFYVAGSLFDAGGSSSNALSCRDGFFMPFKPASGDLLGTTVNSVSPSFASVSHVWAGEDRGASRAGYSNNVALGRLVLSPGGFAPYLFSFAGATGQNGLYVDLLDISRLSDYRNQLEIDPSLVIYFAAAVINSNVVLTPNYSPEEFLDGQFQGRLRWVKEFAGYYSSVDVLVNGNQTIQVNKARRYSKLLDDDGDGVPNFFDFTPFDGVQFVAVEPVVSPSGVRISWQAAAGTVYHVEYKTDFGAPWQQLLSTKFNSEVNGVCSVLDTNAVSGTTMRLYRVMYNPAGH